MLAAIVIFGYATRRALLITIFPGYAGMSVLTAVALVGIALTLIPKCPVRRWFVVPAGASVFIALAVLCSFLFVGTDVLSPAITKAVFGPPTGISGKTSIAAACCILSLGVAQLTRMSGHHKVADWLSAVAMLISGTALMGYAYGVKDLYAVVGFNLIALHTAAALFTLALATLCAQSAHGWASTVASSRPGGGATRRQLAFTLLPPIAGWYLLQTTEARHIGPAMAMALLVVLTVTPLIALILHDGRTLDDLDREREGRARMLAQNAQDLNEKLGEQAKILRLEEEKRAAAENAMFRAQRMEAIGQLTGGIAHDFNNLLMTITGNLEVLRLQLNEGNADPCLADRAIAAAQKGAKLTGQLLAFSRTQKLDVRAVELDPVLHAAHDLIAHALGSKVEIELALNSAGMWVMADPDQIELAILNLAVNARDAMPHGGHFKIETMPFIGRSEHNHTVGKFASVAVSDTGIGMSADVIARATEPFYTTKEHGKGTGLGLAQVYGVIHQCGGQLRIESEPGCGTRIEMLLPLTQALPSSPMSECETSSSSPAPVNEVLLVIDDDDDVRAALVAMLGAAGYQVRDANGGAAGLKLMDTITPAALVVDFMMPLLNGADVARLARQRQPSLPVIFVSGYADTFALDGISGAVVLRKPVSAEKFLGAVEQAVRR